MICKIPNLPIEKWLAPLKETKRNIILKKFERNLKPKTIALKMVRIEFEKKFQKKKVAAAKPKFVRRHIASFQSKIISEATLIEFEKLPTPTGVEKKLPVVIPPSLPSQTSYSRRFMVEFNKFVCGHDSYKDYHDELKKHKNITTTYLVAIISSALGAKFGLAASLLSPPIAILLFSVGQIGLNAYCKNG